MGKRRLIWGIWLLFAALLYFFENNLGTRTLLGASVILPCASMLLAAASAPKTVVTVSGPMECGKGVQANCTIQVKGLLPGALFFGCFTAENVLTVEKSKMELAISASAPKTVSLTAAHCGTLKLSVIDGGVQDMFGLRRSAALPCNTEYMMVAPELFPIDVSLAQSATVSQEGERWSMSRPGFDPGETYAIREYLPGDPVRQIHWKVSEKTGTTMLRELGLPIEEKTLLLFDTTLPSLDDSASRVDAAAEAILSLSAALLQSGVAYSIGWKNRALDELELYEIRAEQEWSAMRERLLSQSSAPDSESVCACFHKWQGETVYAHTVVCAVTPPQDVSVLCAGNRMTLLLFCENGYVEMAQNAYVQMCAPERIREELKLLEI